MKKILFLFAFSTTLFFTNCHKAAPVAWSNIPSTGKVGTSITFVSCSTDAHHVEWDFGNSATATGASVTHAYNTVGTYTVKMTAWNEAKTKSDSKTASITITQ